MTTYTAIDTDSWGSIASMLYINNYTWDVRSLPSNFYLTTAITRAAYKATSVAVTIHLPTTAITMT